MSVTDFQAGDVVICVAERGAAPTLLKGRLYRIAARVPHHHGYILEGITPPAPFIGFWGAHFAKAPGSWTQAGPIRRALDTYR